MLYYSSCLIINLLCQQRLILNTVGIEALGELQTGSQALLELHSLTSKSTLILPKERLVWSKSAGSGTASWKLSGTRANHKHRVDTPKLWLYSSNLNIDSSPLKIKCLRNDKGLLNYGGLFDRT
jgi:hypothetical protein